METIRNSPIQSAKTGKSLAFHFLQSVTRYVVVKAVSEQSYFHAPLKLLSSARVMLVIMLMLESSLCLAWSFAEGHTSAKIDTVARTSYRVFTTISGPEACKSSARPEQFHIEPGVLRLKVGDKLYRDKFIIRAFGSDGEFLPSLPIVIDIIDTHQLLIGRSDQEYAEASTAGVAQLRVAWLCEMEPKGFAKIQISG